MLRSCVYVRRTQLHSVGQGKIFWFYGCVFSLLKSGFYREWCKVA
jgi:hypothetical protein